MSARPPHAHRHRLGTRHAELQTNIRQTATRALRVLKCSFLMPAVDRRPVLLTSKIVKFWTKSRDQREQAISAER